MLMFLRSVALGIVVTATAIGSVCAAPSSLRTARAQPYLPS